MDTNKEETQILWREMPHSYFVAVFVLSTRNDKNALKLCLWHEYQIYHGIILNQNNRLCSCLLKREKDDRTKDVKKKKKRGKKG